jgi:hypothetical protein
MIAESVDESRYSRSNSAVQISNWVKLIATSSNRYSYSAVISLVLGDAVIFQIGVVERFPILNSYEGS